MIERDVMYHINIGNSLDNCIHIGIVYNATFLESIGRIFEFEGKKYIITDIKYSLEREDYNQSLMKSKVRILVQEIN